MGGSAALASAFLWAVSAILFRQLGETFSATAMNLSKGLIALLSIGIILVFAGIEPIATSEYWSLAASGVLGICLGDTLYFMALVRLGPRLTLLLGSLIPVLTGIIAVVFLGERLADVAWMGLALTIIGVTYVLWQGAGENHASHQWRRGLIFAALFIAANAGAIILSKLGVATVAALDATFIRTAWAVAGLSFWALASRNLITQLKPLQIPELLRKMLLAGFIGAFLGTWLSIVALKYTHASVAAALNSTSPLFVLPLAMVFLKQTLDVKSLTGAVIAVIGIAIYFLNV
ncbi:MAG: DMT family transporter [Gammaproteobacteria bacterium]|nr:DMT family transporter [Gammaproteobacteria bacterium]